MYISMVAALMLIFPLVSTVLQLSSQGPAVLGALTIIPIIVKWYVFWAVGVRLFIAGLRQIVQPRRTAETLLGLRSTDALFLVRELGFANTLSAAPDW